MNSKKSTKTIHSEFSCINVVHAFFVNIKLLWNETKYLMQSENWNELYYIMSIINMSMVPWT
jgi:hypothetical protein